MTDYTDKFEPKDQGVEMGTEITDLAKAIRESSGNKVANFVTILVLVAGIIGSYAKTQSELNFLRRDVDDQKQALLQIQKQQTIAQVTTATFEQKLCSIERELKEIKELLRKDKSFN